MIYKKPKCPVCKGKIIAEIDMIPGHALVSKVGKDKYEYIGETEVLWDDQKNVAQIFDNLLKTFTFGFYRDDGVTQKFVTCGEHVWLTKVWTDIEELKCKSTQS